VCADGTNLNRYSQTRPFISDRAEPLTYTSEADEFQEWAEIQEQERRDNAHFASTAEWEKLSPWAQFLILGISIALTAIAWRGLTNDNLINNWRRCALSYFNLYLAVSLLFFNTTAKGSSALAYWLDTHVFFHSLAFVLALLGTAVVGAAPFRRGWDYYFVKHPVADIINSALGNNTPIHGQSLAAALTTNPAEIRYPLPAWHYEHQAEKARKLAEKLDRDADLARAAIARERARNELKCEQEASAADARERVWRRGTLR
jgi:hypothetical protein